MNILDSTHAYQPTPLELTRAAARLEHHILTGLRDGRTEHELIESLALSTQLDRADATRLVTAIARTHRRNEERTAHTRQLVTDALTGYPQNTWTGPVIVDAAPFARRPSFWTQPLVEA